MTSYPINLEAFSKFVGYDNEINVIEDGISKEINFETKKELISLISWFMKKITKNKEKEILDANKSIALILTNLDSSLKKINLYAKSFIKLSEAILSSDMPILNALYMEKEEAIYAFTKYIYKSDKLFQKDEFVNKSEICHYFNLKQKIDADIQSKMSSVCYYWYEIKPNVFLLEKLDILYIWGRLNDDYKFLMDLYGENGKYWFIRKYESGFDEQYNFFLYKYNWIKEHYFFKAVIQKIIAFNNLNRSNCIYNSHSWKNYTNIIIYNIVSGSIASKTLEIGRNCSKSNFIIKLPDFNLFLCRESFYIIDTLTFNIKMITSPINHKFKRGVYYENCIYLFERNKTLKHHYIYKYNLVSNKLSKLSILAEDLGIYSCVIYKNSILIAWLPKNEIYKYDFNIESYSYLPPKLALGNRKILFSNDEKLFLYNEHDAIYENQDDEYYWLPVCKCDHWDLLEMSYIWDKDTIYIGLSGSWKINYYMLDLKSKKLICKVPN